jgi:hypothetical protein
MTGVRRPLAAFALALAAVLVASGCNSPSRETPPATAAPPQEATLNWVERSPETGPALVFRTRTFSVTDDGWRAELEIENTTPVAWELGEDPVAVGQSFGIMLFATNELDEVEQRGANGDLPGLRPARTFDPPLPAKLRPGASWRGTVGATGALAAGRYVRVVFGPLVAEDDPPEGMPGQFYWITDHAYRLRD